jgi:hypothetical protein
VSSLALLKTYLAVPLSLDLFPPSGAKELRTAHATRAIPAHSRGLARRGPPKFPGKQAFSPGTDLVLYERHRGGMNTHMKKWILIAATAADENTGQTDLTWGAGGSHEVSLSGKHPRA